MVLLLANYSIWAINQANYLANQVKISNCAAPGFDALAGTIASMEFRAAIYMSFKKTQCSLSSIVINVIIINFEV
jgi:hypothetical protein